jgi:predicted outer membrane repeat protein
VDSRSDKEGVFVTSVSNGRDHSLQKIVVLHQNIRSLSGKVIELEALLQTDLKYIDVLCFTEHWQSEQKLNGANIVEFKLVSAFCRNSSEHGGSSIYVKECIETKEVTYFQGISEEKNFEMSITELPGYKILIVCVYRSPDGKFDIFLNKLELIIQKLILKDRIFILSGDWNINFLEESVNLNELKILLLKYNLVNTVQSPTRITKNTSTLLDVIILNKKNYMEPSTVIELGLSDHCAQVLPVLLKNSISMPQRIMRRQFGEGNIREFQYLLNKVTWHEVFLETEVDDKFNVFMEIFQYLFDIAFPVKLVRLRNSSRNSWITQGIKISSKKMRFLNVLKKKTNITREVLTYISRYRIIYKRVIREAKKMENDRYILNANNRNKAVWQIINKETGKTPFNIKEIKLNWGSNEITHPKEVAELFNSHFIRTVEELVKRNNDGNIISQRLQLKVNECTETMFMFPVTEMEVEKVVKDFKGKLSAGVDEVPDYVVKQCIQFIKKPLVNIYNASLESGIFPDQLKIARVKPLHKKGDTKNIQNYRPISLLSVFSKILEKLIAFVVRNGILTDAQNGFRKKGSTEPAIQSFLESIQEAIEKKLNPTGIFLTQPKRMMF